MPPATITLNVHVTPRAPRDEIVSASGDAIKIKLRAPPVDDKANDALVKFLAQAFGVRRAQIEIVSGLKSRHKLVRIQGASADRIQELRK
ncbi:MAG: YggU family protein [Chloroflexi bacterium]|nr:YggU family protein [Chloroflexota bacterium]